MRNDILAEVWRNRDEFAKRHNYDLDAMVKALQEMERHPLNAVVHRRQGAGKTHSPSRGGAKTQG